MCNLHSLTKGEAAIIALTRAMRGGIGNLPPPWTFYPDYQAPIVRNHKGRRELAMARWGMPSPALALKGKNFDPGMTNIRNTKLAHWRRWLGIENRCLAPFTSFAENQVMPDG
jgi:putative SOS response-associated peptidase YedK